MGFELHHNLQSDNESLWQSLQSRRRAGVLLWRLLRRPNTASDTASSYGVQLRRRGHEGHRRLLSSSVRATADYVARCVRWQERPL
jgi:hypothetical protein